MKNSLHTTELLQSFPPSVNRQARILLLGSMPGVASLHATQYYAHPRNAFWPIMEALYDAGPDLPYTRRLARLRGQGMALWDVVHRCHRPGSLDADIDPASVRPNDFPAVFARTPRIHTVCFNGRTAESLYRKQVLPDLPEPWRHLRTVSLPSTSPAHAALSFEQKRDAWRTALAAAMTEAP